MSTTPDRTRPSGAPSDLAGRGPLLFALVMAVLGYQINATMLSPALPDVIERLGTTTERRGCRRSLFFLMAAIGQVTLARLSDQRGRKPMMLVCAGVLIAGNLLCVFAPNIEVFIAGRVLQGVSAAMFTLAFLTLNQMLTPAGFGKAAGIITAVNGGLAGVDAVAGGQIADTIGFRGIFVCSTVIAVLGLLGIRRHVPDLPPTTDPGARFDSRGITALALGLTGVLVGLAQGAPPGAGPRCSPWASCWAASPRSASSWSRSAPPPTRSSTSTYSPRGAPLAAAPDDRLHPRRGLRSHRPDHPAVLPGRAGGPRAVGGDVRAAVPHADPAHRRRVRPLTGRLGPRVGWRRIVVAGAAANFVIFAVATVFLHHEWVLVAALAALGVTYGGFMLTGLNGLAVTTAPKDKPGSLSGLNGACFGIGASWASPSPPR